jgi:hypothetical protein
MGMMKQIFTSLDMGRCPSCEYEININSVCTNCETDWEEYA